MRNLIQFIVLVASIMLMTSEAQAGRYCLQGREWGYPGNCQFSTYRQCIASASGTTAGCGINPRYAFERHRQGYYQHYH